MKFLSDTMDYAVYAQLMTSDGSRSVTMFERVYWRRPSFGSRYRATTNS